MDLLESAIEPYVVTCVAGGVVSSSIDLLKDGNQIRLFEVDARSARSVSELFTELGNVLSFPDYFGRNLNALADCMEDERLKGTEPFVLKFSNADNLLGNEMCGALHGLVSTFSFIGASWARAVEEGEPWDCAARRFLVVLEYV